VRKLSLDFSFATTSLEAKKFGTETLRNYVVYKWTQTWKQWQTLVLYRKIQSSSEI